MLRGIIYLNVFLGMKVLGLVWVMLCGIRTTSAASHSLKYFYTAVTAGTDFPEFTALGYVDDEPFTYYDSDIKKKIPKTEWIKENVGEDYWNSSTLMGSQQIYKTDIGVAMGRFNHTHGVHTFQYMYGCEWDDETGATGGFRQFGYDGEDFINLDMKHLRFTASVPQGFMSAGKWNYSPDMLEHSKQYLTMECIEWLKKYVSFGRSALERTVVPEVSLLQKDSSSSVVTCHVTGFYPRGIMVTWQKNGEELDADVELGETVPNEDGTFQIRSHLTVKPEDWKSQKYTCTVEHKSLKQDIVLPVTEENIKRNKDIKTRSFNPEGSSPPMGVIIGGVALLLVLAVICVVLWNKRSSGYGRTNTRSFSPEGSSPPTCGIIGSVVGAVLRIPAFIESVVRNMRSLGYGKTNSYGKTNTSDTDSENTGKPAVKA